MVNSQNGENNFNPGRIGDIKSLRQMVVESLREAIVTGQFKPGDSLKERELSKTMGVSTTPIKEAFRILEHEGLIQTIPRKGAFVSELADTSIHEIQMLRAAVEGVCARLVAVKATEEQLDALEAQIELMEELLNSDQTEQLVEENTNFHTMIRETANSPLLARVLLNVASFDKAFRKRALKDVREVKEGYAEHREIFEAIKSRDAELSEKLIKQHIMRTVEDVLKGHEENK